MAVIVEIRNPNDFEEKIKRKIDSGLIETWTIDDDGDYTHTPAQWVCKAWMHLFKMSDISDCDKNKLVFGIIGNKQVQMTKSLYAVYHGRFAEMLLAHFDDEIDKIVITSNKTDEDFF